MRRDDVSDSFLYVNGIRQKKSVSNIVTSGVLTMKTRFQSIGFHYGNGFSERCSRLTHEGVTSVLYNTSEKVCELQRRPSDSLRLCKSSEKIRCCPSSTLLEHPRTHIIFIMKTQ